MLHLIDNKTDELLGEIPRSLILDGTHEQDAQSKSETLDAVFKNTGNAISGFRERARVLFDEGENSFREFIVENINEVDDNIEFFANASYLEDLDNAKPIEPGRKEQLTVQEYVDFALENVPGWEAGRIEFKSFRTISWTGYQTPYEFLSMVSNRFDMTLRFRVEVEHNKVVNRYVDLVEINHLFNGKEIARGKDLESFTRRVNTENWATALICLGPEQEDRDRLVELIYDKEANEKYNKPDEYIWKVYSPETEDSDMTRSRLISLGRTELNKRKDPEIDYEINAVNLFRLYSHEEVRLYDRVKIKDEEYDRYAEANTKSIIKNILDDKSLSFTFGEIVELDADDVRADFSAMISSLTKRLDESIRNAENIRREIDGELESYERKIEKSETPPESPEEGDFWLDTSHERVAILKRWENGEWVKSSASEAHEVGAITREEALYESLTGTYENLNIRHIDYQDNIYSLLENQYLVDENIKSDLNDRLDTLNDIFVQITNLLQGIDRDTATLGVLVDIQRLIVDYRNEVHYLNLLIRDAEKSVEDRFNLLQSQYTEEKFNDAMNKIADKFDGIQFVDGELIGDMALIQQLEDTKTDLQQQLDDARAEIESIQGDDSDNSQIISQLEDQLNDVNTQLSSAVNQIVEAENRIDATETKITEAENLLTEHGSKIENHGVVITNINDELSSKASQTDLDDLEGTVSNHTTQISQNATEISSKASKDEVDTLSGEVSNHETRITQNATDISSKADKSEVDTIRGTVEDHSTLISQNAEEILSKAEKAYVDTINDTVGNHTTQILQNAEEIQSKASQSEVDTLSGEVSNHETRITQNATDISSKAEASLVDELEGTVSNHSTLISQNAEEIQSKADKSEVDSLSGTVSEHSTQISQNATEIESKADKSEVDTLSGQVSNHETRITQNAEEIESKASQSSYDELSGQVSNHETRITQNATDIQSKASQSEVDEISGQVSNHESTISQHATEINSKVSQSDYDTDHDNIISELSSAETERQQLSNQISDRVTLTEYKSGISEARSYAETKASEAETSAKNHAEAKAQEAKEASEAYAEAKAKAERLIAEAYADGEISKEQQARIDDAKAKLAEAKTHAETKASEAKQASKDYTDLEIDGIEIGGRNLIKHSTFNTSEFFHELGQNSHPITREGYSSGTYTISFEYEVDEVGGSPDRFLLYTDRSFERIPTDKDEDGRVRHTFYLEERDANKRINIYFGSDSSSSRANQGTWFNMQLEKGNKATDWTPAPEDFDTVLTEHETLIEQNGQDIALRATRTETNQTAQTLAQVISQLLIDTTDGLTYTFDENGTITGFNIGPDGMYIDARNIELTGTDEISLNLVDKVDKSNVIAQINMSNETVKIQGENINLVGDVEMVNGEVRVNRIDIGGLGSDGSIRVRDSDNEPYFILDTEQATGSQLSLGDLYVENIHNEHIIQSLDEERVYTVTGNGNDENDGLSSATPRRSVQPILDELPNFINETVTIRVHNSYNFEEIVDVTGFTGSGELRFELYGTSKPSIPLNFKIYGCTIYVVITTDADRATLEGVDNYALLEVNTSNHVMIYKIDVNGTGVQTYGLVASRGSGVYWLTGRADNVNSGAIASRTATLSVQNVRGYADSYGITASRGAIINGSSNGIAGGTTNTRQVTGGKILGSWSFPDAPADSPPPTPPVRTRTRTFTTTNAGHYYVGESWGWNTTFMPSYAFHGKWNNIAMKEGAWFFRNAFDVLNGKTIKRIRVSIGRSSVNSQGMTGRQKFTLRMTPHKTKPSGRPSYSNGFFQGNLRLGERRWFDVTSTFASLIRSSNWSGFGVKVTETSNYRYMAFMKELRVEVTYEE